MCCFHCQLGIDCTAIARVELLPLGVNRVQITYTYKYVYLCVFLEDPKRGAHGEQRNAGQQE